MDNVSQIPLSKRFGNECGYDVVVKFTCAIGYKHRWCIQENCHCNVHLTMRKSKHLSTHNRLTRKVPQSISVQTKKCFIVIFFKGHQWARPKSCGPSNSIRPRVFRQREPHHRLQLRKPPEPRASLRRKWESRTQVGWFVIETKRKVRELSKPLLSCGLYYNRATSVATIIIHIS